ncbi:LexA family transcriptional regulator [Elizabethkingia occulta]|uniref:LexA family transcriptional regulator n=1 Tax=Elizabethkingia occulta TaxID=1867263 RepID=UPI00398C7C37
MSHLPENLRYLRAQLKCSQQKVADDLLITRGRYSKYEDGDSEPPIEILVKISRYYHISIDLMVSIDIRRYPLAELLKLPDNRIVLPIAVDSIGENKIEIIPHKAKMGYLDGYNDPEYIEALQHISLPFLRNGKYRAFPAEGDSMPPFKDGTLIVGEYVEQFHNMKTDTTYILITRNKGIVYKRLETINESSLKVRSNNSFYEPYDIPFQDIIEVWKFACSISTDEYDLLDITDNEVKNMFFSLKDDIQKLNKKIDGKCG